MPRAHEETESNGTRPLRNAANYPCRNYLEVAVAVSGAFIVASVASVSLWMGQVIGNEGQSEKLKSLQKEVDCLDCTEYSIRDERCESCSPWMAKASHEIAPNHCLEQPNFRKSIKKMVKEQSRKEETKLTEEMDRRNGLSTVKAMYQSSRVIVHWFPIGTTQEKDTTWMIDDYERHRSTYTISSGPEGSFYDGRLVVTSAGMYYVYAKVTFECTEADQKMKHVEMKIIEEDAISGKQSIIMSESLKARCALKGDLTTLFQRGIFRLQEKNMLALKYRTSENVQLSFTRDRAYKSSLGLYKIMQ